MGTKKSRSKSKDTDKVSRTHVTAIRGMSHDQYAYMLKLGRQVTALWNDAIQHAWAYWRERGFYPNAYALQEALRHKNSYQAISSDIANATLERLAKAFYNATHHGANMPKRKHPCKPTAIQVNCNRNYITSKKEHVTIPGTQWRRIEGETEDERKKRRERFLKEQGWRLLPKPGDLADEELDSATGFQIVFRKGGYVSLNVQRKVDKETIEAPLSGSADRVMTVDLGVDNLATCTAFDVGEGTEAILDCFIVDGRALKSWNRRYNAHKAELQEAAAICSEDGGDPHAVTRRNRTWGVINRIGDNRDRQVDWYLRSAAARIADRAVASGVGAVFCGWNEGFKSRLSMGRVGNQRFAYIPLARLRDYLMIACAKRGVSFATVDESYTSKASALNLDPLPTYAEVSRGETPRPRFSGFRGRYVAEGGGRRVRRYQRGVYSSFVGGRWVELNSDVNATLNMLRRCRLGAFERVSACLGVTGVLGAVSRPERVMIARRANASTESKKQNHVKPRTRASRFEFSWTSRAMHARAGMYNPKAPTSWPTERPQEHLETHAT